MSVFVDFHSSAVRFLCVQLSSGKEVKFIACKIIVRNYLVCIISLYYLIYVPAVKTSQVVIQYYITETNSVCELVYFISTVPNNQHSLPHIAQNVQRTSILSPHIAIVSQYVTDLKWTSVGFVIWGEKSTWKGYIQLTSNNGLEKDFVGCKAFIINIIFCYKYL
jgi:hypothetical protein